MCGPKEENCLVCGREINEFTDITDFMRCPDSGKSHAVIESRMPKFVTKEDRDAAVEALKKSNMGLDRSITIVNQPGNFSFFIPELEDALSKLMELVPVDGAMVHSRYLACAKCVEGLKRCATCDAEHAPACPVCKAVLVPLREKKS